MNVSIVIATYGDQAWEDIGWARAYPSAVAQDPFEIIVEHQPGGTIASARNAAVARATGDWVCILDADDELDPGYLDAMTRARANRPEPDGGLLLAPATAYVRQGRRAAPMFWPVSDLQDTNWLVIGTLVSRELFHAAGGFHADDPHGLEDWAFWRACVKQGARPVQVPAAVYVAHQRAESSHQAFRRDRTAYMAAYHKVRRRNDPQLYAEEPCATR